MSYNTDGMVKEKAVNLQKDLAKALDRLDEALAFEPTQLAKDATVKRFEFTFELAWKLMQAVADIKGFVERSPNSGIRRAAQLDLIDNPSDWLKYLEKRNLTTHVYNINIANEVYKYAKRFAPDCRKLLEKVEDSTQT